MSSVTGLSANTIYYFRAKAVGDGMSYGAEQSFTTLTLSPPVVTTNGATDVSSSSAILNGTLTSLGPAASANVSFQWWLTDNYIDETMPVSMNATGTNNDNLFINHTHDT